MSGALNSRSTFAWRVGTDGALFAGALSCDAASFVVAIPATIADAVAMNVRRLTFIRPPLEDKLQAELENAWIARARIVRVIRPSVDWLLTAVFGMSRLIIGQKAIRRVDRQVHAVPAARRLSVHDRQPPPLLVDAIRCGLGSISVCGVQEPSLSIDDEIRRV